MEISKTRVAAYVGAGAAVGGGFAALRGGGARGMALGVATGVVAGVAESVVHEKSGSSELGWGAAIGAGAAAGAVLLAGLAPATLKPLARHGVGAAIGGVTGLLAPVVAGVVISQLDKA